MRRVLAPILVAVGGLIAAALVPACFPDPFLLADASPPPTPDAPPPIDAPPIDAPVPDVLEIDAPPPDVLEIDAPPPDAPPPPDVAVPDAMPDAPPPPDVEVPDAMPLPPDAGAIVTAVIGPSGGMLSSPAGVTVIIPRHALDAPTVISIADSVGGGPADTRSQVAKLGPDGIFFHKPVTVKFTAAYAAGETPACFWTAPATDTFEDIGGVASPDGVTCSVVHFSEGYAGLSTGKRTVYGVAFGTFILTDGTIQSFPYDISALAVSALVPDGHGGYGTPIMGKATNAGWFSVPNVPSGEYLLSEEGLFLDTSADTFDLGNDLLGRPDVVAPTMSTTISFNVTNLTPWAATDDLEFNAPNADTWYPDLAENLTSGLPATGATSLTSLVLDTLTNSTNSLRNTGNLLDDDAAYLGELTAQMLADGTPYLSLARVFQPAPFVQTDGMPTSLSGAFVQLNEVSTTFSLATSQFAATTGMGPGARFAGAQLTINAQPTGAGDGGFSNEASLVYMAPTAADHSGTVSYGMPPTGTWAAIGNALGYFEVDYTLQGATPIAELAFLEDDDLIGPLTQSPIAPVLGPVGSPTVGGKAALPTPITGVGLAPTVTWQPPTLGTAQYYVVFLNQLSVASGATQSNTTAIFFTAGTTITLPTGMLATGQSYYILVIAVADGLGVTQPSRVAFPQREATMFTAMFSP